MSRGGNPYYLYKDTIMSKLSPFRPELITELMIVKDNKPENVKVIIEHVTAMPGQGVTSMFNFGQSFGILKGVCSAMNLSMHFVRPAKWKKHFNLINASKDASRTKAIEIFPYFSINLSKKKDANKV